MNAACMSALSMYSGNAAFRQNSSPTSASFSTSTQRFARPQEIQDQFAAARDRRVAIAAPVGEFEGRLDELTATRDGCRPRHDGGGEETGR